MACETVFVPLKVEPTGQMIGFSVKCFAGLAAKFLSLCLSENIRKQVATHFACFHENASSMILVIGN